MRSKISRIFCLTVLALSIPLLTFAGGRASNDSGARLSVVSATPAVHTPETQACVQEGKHTCPNWNDGAAFHK
jgi:hypothetical protein